MSTGEAPARVHKRAQSRSVASTATHACADTERAITTSSGRPRIAMGSHAC